MTVEIDHIILFTRDAERDAAKLRDVGLTEGSPNTHPGQGTACRRFFFRNTYLELLYLTDESDARSVLTAPTRLWERLRGDAGVCPFGIALRAGASGDTPLFPCWEYRSQYLPSELCIHMAENTEVLGEPLLLFMSFAKRPDAYTNDRRQPLEHTLNVRELKAIRMQGPAPEVSSTSLQSIANANLLRLQTATDYALELEFDVVSGQFEIDLRPEIPLLLRSSSTNTRQ